MSRRPHDHNVTHESDHDHAHDRMLCRPHSNHLPKPAPGPVNPPPTRVEDLEPPYSAFPRINIQLAPYPEVGEYGLGIRHVRPYAQFVLEQWHGFSLNDYFAVYLNDLNNAAADDIALESRNAYDLFVPEERVPEGEVKIYARVERTGPGTPSTSPIQTILIKTTRPGGIDTDPGNPWHTGLRLSVEGFPAGSVISPPDVVGGLWCLIERYEHIRHNDVIDLSWDGIFVHHTVSPSEAAGPGPVRVFVPKAVIDAGGQAGELTIRFRVQDVVKNFSGEKYQYSKSYFLSAELDSSLLLAPRFLVDGELLDSKQIDFDTQSDAAFEVLINTGPVFPTPNPRRQITVMLVGTLEDGTSKTYPLGPVIDNNFGVTFVPVDNGIIKELIGGSFRISYTWHTQAGVELGRSGSLTITVVGTPSSMPVVDVSPIELGLIPTDTAIMVTIPPYTPHNASWLERLVIRHIPSGGGGGIFFKQEQLAGAQGGVRYVTAAEMAPFSEVGPIEIFYEVDDGSVSILDGSVLTVRQSDILGARVGERTADMPQPILQGAIGNNVNPADVPGLEVLLTFPYEDTLNGDTLYFSCIGSGVGGSFSGSISINGSTAGKALPYPVPRSILDNNLNGSLRISYSLHRPGTPPLILRSEVLHLTVGVGVYQGRPVIVGASLLPDELNPLAALAGATVLARINPTLATDYINFDWFTDDGIGSATLGAPGNATTHETSVTFLPRTIAKCIREGGSTIDVQYRFNRGSFPYYSDIVFLRLLPLTGLPTPKIDGIDGTMLELSRLDPNARTRVAMWHFIHPNQRMWMSYTGTQGGLPWTEDTYTANLVTDDGVANGIRPPTPVDKLKLLDDGSALTIKFWVSLAESADKTTAILFGVAHFIVQALPSVLPHPFIGGTADVDQDVTVAPLSIEHNTTVTVKYAGMSGNDVIRLRWIYADGTHDETSLRGVAGGELVFNLTSAKVLHRSVNSTVQLRYWVDRGGVEDPIPSQVQTVRVGTIPAASLAGPRINGLASGSTLDLSAFTGNGVASLAKWALSNINQRAWITCSSAGVTPLEVLGAGGALISAPEAANGLVNKAVGRAWLEGLADRAQITVTAVVNYAGDQDRTKAVTFTATNYSVLKSKLNDITNFEGYNFNGWRNTGTVGALVAFGTNVCWVAAFNGPVGSFGLIKNFRDIRAGATYTVYFEVYTGQYAHPAKVSFGPYSKYLVVNHQGPFKWIGVAASFDIPPEHADRDLDIKIEWAAVTTTTYYSYRIDNIRVYQS